MEHREVFLAEIVQFRCLNKLHQYYEAYILHNREAQRVPLRRGIDEQQRQPGVQTERLLGKLGAEVGLCFSPWAGSWL